MLPRDLKPIIVLKHLFLFLDWLSKSRSYTQHPLTHKPFWAYSPISTFEIIDFILLKEAKTYAWYRSNI